MSAPARRDQILDTTRELVGEAGFHGVSLDAIARRAGISRPVVYEHFGDLPGVFDALVERESARALRELAELLPTDLSVGDPRETLLDALRGYLDAVAANPVTWRLVLMPEEGAPAMLRRRITECRAAVIGLLATAIGAEGGGPVGSPDAELTARMLSAIADEAARLVLTDPERYPVERVLAHTHWALRQFGL